MGKESNHNRWNLIRKRKIGSRRLENLNRSLKKLTFQILSHRTYFNEFLLEQIYSSDNNSKLNS